MAQNMQAYRDLAFEQSPSRRAESQDRPTISAAEFSDRAREIGMEPEGGGDVAFRWIVNKSFTDPLPAPWVDAVDEDGQKYFYNTETEDGVWEHPALDKYRSLYLNTKAEHPLPPPPAPNTAASNGGHGYHTHNQTYEAQTYEEYNGVDLEAYSGQLEAEIQGLKSLLFKCQTAVQINSKNIVKFLIQRGRKIAGVEDAESAVPDRVELALQHLRRVTQALISADQEVSANVIVLRKKVTAMEERVEDSQEQAAVQQQRVEELLLEAEASGEKWTARLDRKKRLVQSLTDEVEELKKLNAAATGENKQIQRELQLGHLHSSTLEEEKVNLKVEAEQDKLKFMESTAQELREQLKESRQQCKDADKAADKAELQLRTEELRTAASLKNLQEDLEREQRRLSEKTAAAEQLEDRVTSLTEELATANNRAHELETGMGQKSSDYAMLNERLKEEVQRERVDLRAKLDAERERCVVLATTEASLRAQLDGASSKIKKGESEYADMRDKVAAAESNAVKLSAELKVTQAKCQALEQRVTHVLSELSREREQVLECTKNEALQSAKLDSQSEMHNTQMQHLDGQILTLREEVQVATAARQQLESASARNERELGQAQAALEGLRVTKAEAEERAATLSASVLDLESRLAGSRSSLEGEAQQRQALEQRIEA